jgi:HlyD family secretion protein
LTSKTKAFTTNINTKTIWAVSVLIILMAVAGYYYFKIKTSSQAIANDSVAQTAVARRGNLVLSASGTGTLVTQTNATFGFKTSGQITKVNVKVGDQVEAGQVLAQLDDTLIQMKYVEAQQALQELFSAASISNVQQQVATAQDTAAAARAWLTYLFSPTVIDAEDNLADAQQKLADAHAQAKANPSDAANKQVQDSQAAVTYLKTKLDQAWTYYSTVYGPETFTEYKTVVKGRRRIQVVVTYTDPVTGKELPKIDWPSADDTAKARNNRAQALQTIKDGQAYLEAVKTGVIPEGATGAQLNNINDAQQALKNAQAAVDETKLISPISGTVTAMDLNLGEPGNTTTAITISQLDQPYTVDGSLDQTDWIAAKVGNKVNVTFDLLSGKTFPATVTTVYPVLDTSGDAPLVHVVVQLDQSISQNLPAGTGASLEVIGGEADNAVMVPTNAVHKNSNGSYEVVVIQNGQRIKKQVEVGLQGTAYVEIKSGLNVGEIVATK